MARAKVKKISMLNKEDADTLGEMFEQMAGTGNADPEIIRPKIVDVKTEIKTFCRVYTLFLKTIHLEHIKQEYINITDQISKFLKEIKDNIHVDENTGNISEAELYKKSGEELNAEYKEYKNNHCVRKIIITSSNLLSHKNYIDDQLDGFILKETGLSLCPFAFSTLFDLKDIWMCEETSDIAKKFILILIQKTLKIGIRLHEIINSPDIDIKKFSEIIIASIMSNYCIIAA